MRGGRNLRWKGGMVKGRVEMGDRGGYGECIGEWVVGGGE